MNREEIEAIVRANTGPCRCDEAYTSRDLRDPQCAWCDVGEGIVEDFIDNWGR